MAPKQDLTGQRFGQLVVIAPEESDRHGKSRWRCRCDCGTDKTVLAGNLRNGTTVSCGCKGRRDLAGQRFGTLLVLERSDRYAARGSRKQQLWKCLCDCGQVTYKATDVLTNPDKSMCSACAGKYSAEKARNQAGYQDGTQLSRIRNISEESDNLSGIRGVYLDPKTGKYRARIKFQGKIQNLGTFLSLEEAVKARRRAEEDIFGTFLETLTP